MMKVTYDKVAKLFGVAHHDETDSYSIKHRTAWEERRKRLLNRRCGKLAKAHDDSCQAGQLTHPHSDTGDIPPDTTVVRAKRKQQQRNRFKRDHPPTFSGRQSASALASTDRAKSFNLEGHDGEDDVLPTNQPSITSSRHTFSAPVIRTISDTAIKLTTAKPQPHQDQQPQFHQQKHLESDSLSLGSYDITDFDAKESVVKLINDVLARHQPRRAFGMGLVGNLLSRKFRKDLTNTQLNAIYSFNDHRPYFTYWVTTVQILIMIITLLTYGFGPFGFSETIVKSKIRATSSAYELDSYTEKHNIWLGPVSQDLIHLGAKFTPCMRRDSLIYKEIDQKREEEKLTGCCIRNDESGCLQTKRQDCSEGAKWHSWSNSSTTFNNDAAIIPMIGKKRRLSGPVCGQDPEYCRTPASRPPHEWPDDISKWPICQEPTRATRQLHHMSCDVVGRPCCIGIYGQCLLTSSQRCQFRKGTFHPEARLCSQVSCMEDVCGMVPFYARDYPDQFYRLFTALFLHAGLIHLSFTVILQYYIMRDIERLLGSTRMAIIYILPGVAGYLASATFVPYHTQVGPSGSQFALLACLMAETINSWNYLENPQESLWIFISIAFGLFMVGLLPWIDNYAHIFGFLVGLMLSLALTPYLTPFSDAYSRRKKLIQIWLCISLVILTFVLLPLPLYIFPLYKCSWCQYLDCWPLTPNWCENHDMEVTKLDIF